MRRGMANLQKLDLAYGGGISTLNWIGWRKATEHLW
jgi:hypothetical protein